MSRKPIDLGSLLTPSNPGSAAGSASSATGTPSPDPAAVAAALADAAAKKAAADEAKATRESKILNWIIVGIIVGIIALLSGAAAIIVVVAFGLWQVFGLAHGDDKKPKKKAGVKTESKEASTAKTIGETIVELGPNDNASGLLEYKPDQSYLVQRIRFGIPVYDPDGDYVGVVGPELDGWRLASGATPLIGGTFVWPFFEMATHCLDTSKLVWIPFTFEGVQTKDDDDVSAMGYIETSVDAGHLGSVVTAVFGQQGGQFEAQMLAWAREAIQDEVVLHDASDVLKERATVSSAATDHVGGLCPRLGLRKSSKVVLTHLGKVRAREAADDRAKAKATTGGKAEGIGEAVIQVAGDPGVQGLLATIAGIFRRP